MIVIKSKIKMNYDHFKSDLYFKLRVVYITKNI